MEYYFEECIKDITNNSAKIFGVVYLFICYLNFFNINFLAYTSLFHKEKTDQGNAVFKNVRFGLRWKKDSEKILESNILSPHFISSRIKFFYF